MKRQIKSYLVFQSLGTKILAYVIEPFALLAGGIFVSVWFGMPGYQSVGFIMTMIELLLDYLMFAGICAKDVSHLEYLKSSKRGDKIVSAALRTHLIRALLVEVIFLLFHAVFFHWMQGNLVWNMEEIWLCVQILTSSYFVIVLVETIGRFFDSIQILYGMLMLAMLLEAGLLVLLLKSPIIITIIVSILTAGISVLNVKIAGRKIKESYYDKTVENGI